MTFTETPFGPPLVGTIGDGTRRFAVDPPYREVFPRLAAADVVVLALAVQPDTSTVPHGHFYRLSGSPDVYVPASVVAVDYVASLPPDSGLSPDATLPPVPTNPNVPAPVLAWIVDRFRATNPGIGPDLASTICQALGANGASAQELVGGMYAGLVESPAVKGLITTATGLPVYETEPVPDGTVLANDGLGAGGMGIYLQGAWADAPQPVPTNPPTLGYAGHESAQVSVIQTGQGPRWLTVIDPGTDHVNIGAAGTLLT